MLTDLVNNHATTRIISRQNESRQNAGSLFRACHFTSGVDWETIMKSK